MLRLGGKPERHSLNTDLIALLKGILGETITSLEEVAKDDLNPVEIERFTINTSHPVNILSLAERVVKGFHAKHVSAEHIPYSSFVSHVFLTRADFRVKIVILSEENFISVVALRLM